MTSISSQTIVSQNPICYRKWLVSTTDIDGKLWIRWQNPQESFPYYSYEVGDKSLSEVICYVRFIINLAIKLEDHSPDGETDQFKP